MIMNGKQLNIRILLLVMLIALSGFSYAVTYRFVPGKGLEFSWDASDKVGITTAILNYGEMEQQKFQISSQATISQRVKYLYAVGYQLKSSTAYYSYSPYISNNAFSAYNITCRYDQQTQNGNGSTVALSQCDYQMAATVSTATECVFEYQRIGGVLRVTFLAPSAMTVTALTVKSETPMVATTATMDIVNQRVTLGARTTAVTLTTQNITVAKGDEVTLYLALPAQDLSSSVLDITVSDANGTEYPIAKIMGPNVKAGKMYDITLTNAPRAFNSKSFTSMMPQVNAVGISNPVVSSTDILLDNDFTLQLVETRKKGDVNGDGEINLLDAALLIREFIDNRTSTLDASYCDVNSDGKINLVDAAIVQNMFIHNIR